MSFSVALVVVNGFHVLSSEKVFGHDNVFQNDMRELSDTLILKLTWGLSEKFLKVLQANPDFFKSFAMGRLFLLVSEDEKTVQCIQVLQVNHHLIDKHGVSLELLIGEENTPFYQRVKEYLIRKAENEFFEKEIERRYERLVEVIKGENE